MYRDLFAYILSFTRDGGRAARDEGRPLSRSIATQKARDPPASGGPSDSSDPRAPPGSLRRPRGSPRHRRIGPKEGGRGDAGLSKGWRGPLPHPRYTDGAISAEGAVAAWARVPGTRAAPDGGAARSVGLVLKLQDAGRDRFEELLCSPNL